MKETPQPQRPTPTRRSLGRRSAEGAGLALAGVAVAVLIAEVALGLLGIPDPEFYRVDPDLGGSHVPGAEGWWTQEGNVFVRINAEGQRDRAHSLEKPARTRRIAVLGDSYAEAFQVPLEQAFWSVAERELAGCAALAGSAPEVLNFGVAGYGTAQELLMLRHRVWRYAPDVVVLAFLTGNDLRNNSRALQGSSGRPYFVYDERGELILDDRFSKKWEIRWRRAPLGAALDAVLLRSRVLQLTRAARRSLRARAEQRVATTTASAELPAELGLDNQVYKPPSDPAWQEAWSISEGLIRLMRDEVEAKGARFLLTVLSNPIQIHRDASERRRFAEALGVASLWYPDRRLAAFANREGIAHQLLGPPLLAAAEAEGVCLHGASNRPPCTGHWNEHGHRLAGQLLAEMLCSDVIGTPAASAARVTP